MTHANTAHADIMLDRFGFKVAGQLALAQNEMPYDIGERLRAARMQALAKRKTAPAVHTEQAVIHQGGAAALSWGQSEGLSWWSGLGSALPLLALVLGLMLIQTVQDETRLNELAAVDTALLTDELPPQAYTDPGFAQFLKHQP